MKTGEGDAMSEDIVDRLLKRAEIRQKIPRPEPDRISRDCEEAAREIISLRATVEYLKKINGEQ